MSTSVCIAIDVMGGDHGPRCVVPAAADALRRNPDLHLLLVGLRQPLLDEVERHALPADRVTLHFCTETIEADDSPASMLRGKRDASMRVALELLRDGAADGCLSAGNTGALMVLSRSLLGMLEGVERPAIMAALPVAGKPCHVLDLGANVDCSARQLFEFALMGSVAVSEMYGLPSPRIGLLNIGHELNKGGQQVREVSELLRQCASLNYIGHVEGDGLFRDQADVVVCDGFVGNVVLKASEGLAVYLQQEIRQALANSLLLRCMAPLLRRALRPVTQRHDPTAYNGASLLGLPKVVVKSHGAAGEQAFAAAIDYTVRACQAGLPQRIAGRVAQVDRSL
ncbi:phosphate acyltransferase PlsX [Halopseudomonas yangmingensis]|nr:phosphate acyltransferase PlsX [Halopseudomonas yangmingensis]